MKGKLLTVKEISELKLSDKKYFVESKNEIIPSGLYVKSNIGWLENENKKMFACRCGSISDGVIKVYEWNEDIINPIKTYELEEAIKMLAVNPKLKFETALLLHDSAFIESECTTTLQIQGDFIAAVPYGIPYISKWTLVEQPVTFMEAAYAFSEGKNVRCEYKETGVLFTPTSSRFMSLTTDAILKAKWYIENEH